MVVSRSCIISVTSLCRANVKSFQQKVPKKVSLVWRLELRLLTSLKLCLYITRPVETFLDKGMRCLHQGKVIYFHRDLRPYHAHIIYIRQLRLQMKLKGRGSKIAYTIV